MTGFKSAVARVVQFYLFLNAVLDLYVLIWLYCISVVRCWCYLVIFVSDHVVGLFFCAVQTPYDVIQFNCISMVLFL